MVASLTEKEFAQHLNTKFVVSSNDQPTVCLELVDVKSYGSEPEEQKRMERFSVYFQGPPKPYLPQATYIVRHDAMGEFELFIVPISQDSQGFRYEAVFNYFRDHPSTK